jgi:hypothetical protein
MKISAKDHLTGIMAHSHSGLAKIFEAYSVHQTLTQQFVQDISGEWREQLTFVLYRGGILTLAVKNSAMRMRMQYEKNTLIEQLRQKKTWAGLKDIKIQVSA